MTCTVCGKAVSLWQRDFNSGACSQCRQAAAAKDPLNISNLTLAGWLLTAGTVMAMTTLAILYGRWLYDLLPPGRYPRLLLALPLLGVAALIFCAGYRLLNSFGIPVWKRARDPGRRAGSIP
jgi:hypothetical protein